MHLLDHILELLFIEVTNEIVPCIDGNKLSQ